MESKNIPEWKVKQAESRQVKARLIRRSKENMQKFSLDGTAYIWTRKGLKTVGVIAGESVLPLHREPANKKERRKSSLGLAYRDKQGLVKADDRG